MVTVAMAARDAAAFVGDALASLRCQTLDDLEILVVDDGSADGTGERVKAAARLDPRIRLMRWEVGRGQAAALNLAMAEARGRYLATLDADDLATPERLARQVAALEEDSALVLVGGAASTWSDRLSAGGEVWRYACQDEDIRVRNLFKSEFISGAMTFDLERLRRHHLRFDERLRLGVDWDLSSRAMRVGRVANVREVVLRYRIHAGQMTSGMIDDLRSDSARIRREALAWVGVEPSEDELRVHLAVSPCNYWAFGTHPEFRARGFAIADHAARWFDRLGRTAPASGRISAEALRAYLDEIAASVEACLATPCHRRAGARPPPLARGA